ncbi:phosphotransferase [Modestobacter sp. VKM Ac-2983]|uniref:phosphotransferase n=1 Tax=Modestobacter sp. VKM Ac-2983 TaxID=3004137 RepID=UPI0022ABC2AE|nr:phosphotransferase [Modestobacter sp. VKM Ac-2983]MCZ2804751.1 phosphotransferase [Modestobacter sp. VKM Ac-2983]
MLEVCGQLGLGAYREALALDNKPRFVFAFAPGDFKFADGTSAEEIVLKVYARPHPGEGTLLTLWREQGVPVPRVSFGDTSNCDWLALERLSGQAPRPSLPQDRFEMTDEISRFGPRMHDVRLAPRVVLRQLLDTMLPRFCAAVSALQRCGYGLSSAWIGRAEDTYAAGEAGPLHGDLTTENILVTEGRRLYLIDPSALHGDPSFDAARWAARLSGPGCEPDVLLEHWSMNESFPDRGLAERMLAIECILQAGSRELIKAEVGMAPCRGDHATTDLIAAAGRAWRWHS